MIRGALVIGVAATALFASADAISAQELLKLGLVQSMTGAFNTSGKAIVNGALLYLKQHGDVVAGRKVQRITKDDAFSLRSRCTAMLAGLRTLIQTRHGPDQ